MYRLRLEATSLFRHNNFYPPVLSRFQLVLLATVRVFHTGTNALNKHVFMVYMSSSGGADMGYFLAGRSEMSPSAKAQMRRIVLLRSVLVFLLVVYR